jgi:hypothetical protein
MELAIVVARRSWLEISLWKTGNDRKKEKGKKEQKKKEERWYPTTELNRRDQVTAPVPGPVSFERGKQRSIIR